MRFDWHDGNEIQIGNALLNPREEFHEQQAAAANAAQESSAAGAESRNLGCEVAAPDYADRVKELLVGKPVDLNDRTIFKRLSLIAFFAWVAVGSDLLSSSCYGPPAAFETLAGHHELAPFLALMTIGTVGLISLCYARLVEHFPHGGGGYIVASKLLGPRWGVVSGSALLVDYVLTITVSVAAAGDAIGGMFGAEVLHWKLPAELAAVVLLIVLNLRGLKESVIAVLPIFLLFLVTHALLVGGTLTIGLPEIGAVAHEVSTGLTNSVRDPQLGLLGVCLLLLHAYSLGAGTYTGIEAVSNTMPVLREPRVKTAQRTLLYMALSLSIVAGGLLLGYMLLAVKPVGHETFNHALARALVGEVGLGGSWIGSAFIGLTLLAEGALLIVAAQAGFVDGPRVLAYMAQDYWVPNRFASLSERLTAHYGILLMGFAALGLLLFSEGSVALLVVMYSINVFITFSLSMISMCRLWNGERRKGNPLWRKRLALFGLGAALCVSVLAVTIVSKFTAGGWHTLAVTALCIVVCFFIRRHYVAVQAELAKLDQQAQDLETPSGGTLAPIDPSKRTAVIAVSSYGGLGVQILRKALRFLPGYFDNVVFLSVGVVDSGVFKGEESFEGLRAHTAASLSKYVAYARRAGLPATSYMTIGTDPVRCLEELCVETAKQYPHSTFFAGHLIFGRDTWLNRILHNQLPMAIERRLQYAGLPVVVLPIKVG
ncbi:MAG: APC family permease [Pirellulales bacterium]|nr:APC family permease [Pirellulales bacterium]